jgi:hypothetical protein
MGSLLAVRWLTAHAGLALVALVIVAWPHQAVASTTPALFQTELLDDTPGQASGILFDMSGLYSGGDTERITIAVPAGFSVSLAQPVGSNLGVAGLSLTNSAGRNVTSHSGSLVVLGAQAWTANAAAQSCSPGSHTATWAIVTPLGPGTIEVPIAVDRSGEGYTLTVCYDALHARHLVPAAASFTTNGVFANPIQGGKYFFDGIVTPYSSDGKPDPAQAYEFRSYELLPDVFDMKPTYDKATLTFSVTGTLAQDGFRTSGVAITIYAGSGPVQQQMTQVGTTQTGDGGRFSFSKRLARQPRDMYAIATSFWYQAGSSDGIGCLGVSRAPRGCTSYNIDGAASAATPLVAGRR